MDTPREGFDSLVHLRNGIFGILGTSRTGDKNKNSEP
jgi:hypothetical protein